MIHYIYDTDYALSSNLSSTAVDIEKLFVINSQLKLRTEIFFINEF